MGKKSEYIYYILTGLITFIINLGINFTMNKNKKHWSNMLIIFLKTLANKTPNDIIFPNGERPIELWMLGNYYTNILQSWEPTPTHGKNGNSIVGAKAKTKTMTSLFDAKTVDDVIRALERGDNINEFRNDINEFRDKTPLYVACENGNVEVVEALLNHGANLYVFENWDIVGIAAKNGYVNIIERLFQAGVNINYGTIASPLIYASREGHIDVIDFLISHGANINYPNQKGNALMAACEFGQIDAMDRLLAAGADVNIILDNEFNEVEIVLDNALAIACNKGDLTMVDKLIVHGAKINMDDRDPPLIAAVMTDNEKIINRLIDLGADVNIDDKYGEPVLISAIENNSIIAIQLLMNKGADPKPVGGRAYNSSWPLIDQLLYLYDRGNIDRDDFFDIMNKFVILGVDINHIYDNGNTILMDAVEDHDIDRVRRLLELGANVNVHNDVGQTALLIARRNNDEPIIELLLEHGAQ